jgi:hypothetical protein
MSSEVVRGAAMRRWRKHVTALAPPDRKCEKVLRLRLDGELLAKESSQIAYAQDDGVFEDRLLFFARVNV